MKTKRQFNYTPNFLASAENHCFFCSVDGVGVRKYYKYNYKKLKEFNNFSKISIHQLSDSRLNESWFLCDACKIYWEQTPEYEISLFMYKKIDREHRQADPEFRLKKQQYDYERRSQERTKCIKNMNKTKSK